MNALHNRSILIAPVIDRLLRFLPPVAAGTVTAVRGIGSADAGEATRLAEAH